MKQKSTPGSTPDAQHKLLAQPVNTLLMKMAMPMVIGMLINGLYNLVDAFFVSRYIGSQALAAVSIVFPLQMIIIALATTISNGTSILVSRYMGAGRLFKVNAIVINAVQLIVVFSLSIATLSLLFNPALQQLLGVPEALKSDVNDYFIPLATGSALVFTLSLFSDLLRAQGRMEALFVGILASAAANLVLDWLFIAVFEWQVLGAALATLAGQLLGCITGLIYLRRRSPLMPGYAPNCRVNISTAGQILALGLPVMLQYMGAALIIGVINALITSSLTPDNERWLSAYGLIGRLNIFVILPLIALTNVAQTIISFNHGSGHAERVEQTLKLGLKVNMAYLSVLALVLLVFPHALLAGFTDNRDIIDTGAKIARMMFLLLPLAGISFMTTAYFQGVGKAPQALLLTLTKVYLLILPLLFLIESNWGYQKLWYAFPAADIATVLLATVLFTSLRKRGAALTAQGNE